MPAKTKKSVRSRRKYGKKRTSKRSTTMVNRSLQPFPSRFITKMKYSGTVRINNGTSAAVQIWRLNSLFDPDVTFTGHQPYGRDTLATLYNRYRVISVRYYIQAIAASGKTQLLALTPTNDPISETDIDALREKPRCRSYVLASGAAGVPSRLTGKINLPALTGKTKSQYMADDRYQAQFSTEPAEAMYLYCNIQDMDKTTIADVYASVMLEFTVECFDPILLNQS